MLGIGSMLAGLGINFVKDLIMDNGEDLVKEGIKKVTGIDLNKKELTPEDIAKIKSHELEIKQLDFKKLEEEHRHNEAKHAKSHETYQINHAMADTIAKQIISRNLPIIAILVLVNISVVYYMEDKPSLIAIASNIIGVAIANLFNERQAIVNFFFGSSLGSKEKDKQLNKQV
jgi:hypothetical protein